MRRDDKSVCCRCGARWVGKSAINNPVIDSHRDRCGAPITEEEFRLRWPKTQARWTIERSDDPVVELERAAWARHRGRTDQAKARLREAVEKAQWLDAVDPVRREG